VYFNPGRFLPRRRSTRPRPTLRPIPTPSAANSRRRRIEHARPDSPPAPFHAYQGAFHDGWLDLAGVLLYDGLLPNENTVLKRLSRPSTAMPPVAAFGLVARRTCPPSVIDPPIRLPLFGESSPSPHAIVGQLYGVKSPACPPRPVVRALGTTRA
jgi:hypothetical protein